MNEKYKKFKILELYELRTQYFNVAAFELNPTGHSCLKFETLQNAIHLVMNVLTQKENK